jgi:putative DNA primase/helicase
MLMACKHEGIPNDIARLPGVRMAVCSELDEGMRFNESLVKDLTGNDTVTARFLHQEFFDFKPSHKLFICGNSKPRVIGTDTGIWRRMILIPFTVEIPADRRKPIAEMLTIFRKEASGILNWMLEGYQAYKKDGLDIPQEVHAATAQYRSASDVVGYYLNENCNIGSALTISISDLYLDYKAWTREAGEFTLSKRRFGEHLVDRGFTKTRGTGGTWLWEGLGSKMNGNLE